MKRSIGRTLRAAAESLWFGLRRATEIRFPPDFGADDIELIRKVRRHTLSNPLKIYSMIRSVEHLVNAGVPGAIVECGVWRGGSMLAAALTLTRMGRVDRDLFLFDTFEGNPEPSDLDVNWKGESAVAKFHKEKRIGSIGSSWCCAGLEDVRRVMWAAGYDNSKIHFIKGKVEDTIPGEAPEAIALLRLDTDFYDSTLHELVHLFPRVSVGGIIIIDDYAWWLGAKKAVDEYIQANNLSLFLSRVDHSARLAVKMSLGSGNGREAQYGGCQE
jgi:hypothetical protein